MKVRRVEIKIYAFDGKGANIYTFKYPEYNISFRINQTDSDKTDSASVAIAGIDKSTYGVFRMPNKSDYDNGHMVEIYHGYDDYLELVYRGKASSVDYDFSDGQQVLAFVLGQENRKFNTMAKPVSTSGSITLKELCGLITKTYTTDSGAQYMIALAPDVPNNLSVGKIGGTMPLSEFLNTSLPEEYGYYIKIDKIFIYSKKGQNSGGDEYVMFSQNGLLRYPIQSTRDKDKNEFNITTILIPQIKCGDVIKIPVDEYWYSKFDTGNYKRFVVKGYNSSFNEIGQTELRCIEETDDEVATAKAKSEENSKLGVRGSGIGVPPIVAGGGAGGGGGSSWGDEDSGNGNNGEDIGDSSSGNSEEFKATWNDDGSITYTFKKGG